MYTQAEYVYGWVFYLLGVAILMACGWWLTRSMRSADLRQLLRLGVLVFLLIPWYAAPEMSYLAPAWIIAGFEGLVDGGAAFWRAGGPLLSGVGIALGLCLCAQIARRLFVRARGKA